MSKRKPSISENRKETLTRKKPNRIKKRKRKPPEEVRESESSKRRKRRRRIKRRQRKENAPSQLDLFYTAVIIVDGNSFICVTESKSDLLHITTVKPADNARHGTMVVTTHKAYDKKHLDIMYKNLTITYASRKV